jgi:PAS domain S-box-containing protein
MGLETRVVLPMGDVMPALPEVRQPSVLLVDDDADGDGVDPGRRALGTHAGLRGQRPAQSRAQDYIVKPFSPDEFEARLAAARRVGEEHRRLTVSEARYRQLVDLAAEGLFAVDAGGLVTFVNGAMSVMLGRDQGQIVGHPMSDFSDDDSGLLTAAKMAAPPLGRAGAFTSRFVHASGEIVWVEVAAALSHDDLSDG